MSKKYFLVLDIGTSGTKGVLFDRALKFIGEERLPFVLQHPKKGWVEEDPRELFKKSIDVLRRVMKKSQVDPREIISFGITNQRETTILWNRKTGKPIYPAIVWQDVRTQARCAQLRTHRTYVREKTGLTIDPYFSASKIEWILQNVPAAKKLLATNQLCFGTVDTWILFCLTKGQVHATDETNASRTLLFNVRTRSWDRRLQSMFGVPASILPQVKQSQDDFGEMDKAIFGASVPIRAMCGDQQSSLYAAGNRQGVTKVTYGTGTFIGQHLGSQFVLRDGFFTTMMPSTTCAQFALEGKIARGGKEVEPLLDRPKALRIFLDRLARDTDRVLKQLPVHPKKIFVDGGVTRNKILFELQTKYSTVTVKPLAITNGTALGTAKLLHDFFASKQ